LARDVSELCGKRNFKRRREQSLSAFFYHVAGTSVAEAV